jgi:hypothetical protein
MDPFTEVSEIPVLNQRDYPDLPPIMEGWVVTLSTSLWKNSKTKESAAVLIQCCLEAKIWRPLTRQMVAETLWLYLGYKPRQEEVWGHFTELRQSGDVKFMMHDGVEYIVPQPSFGRKALPVGESDDEYQPAKDSCPPRARRSLRGWGTLPK